MTAYCACEKCEPGSSRPQLLSGSRPDFGKPLIPLEASQVRLENPDSCYARGAGGEDCGDGMRANSTQPEYRNGAFATNAPKSLQTQRIAVADFGWSSENGAKQQVVGAGCYGVPGLAHRVGRNSDDTSLRDEACQIRRQQACGGKMHSVGRSCHRDINPAVYQDFAVRTSRQTHRSTGQLEEFLIGQVLLPQLNEINPPGNRLRDPRKQDGCGHDRKKASIRYIVKERAPIWKTVGPGP